MRKWMYVYRQVVVKLSFQLRIGLSLFLTICNFDLEGLNPTMQTWTAATIPRSFDDESSQQNKSIQD